MTPHTIITQYLQSLEKQFQVRENDLELLLDELLGKANFITIMHSPQKKIKKEAYTYLQKWQKWSSLSEIRKHDASTQ